MTIYGRFGDVVTIVRKGKLQDVVDLDKRKPDNVDKDVVARGGYVVIKQDDGKEVLYNLGYLRADRGSLEIDDAIKALEQTGGN